MEFNSAFKGLKGKAVPLQAWTGPEVSRKLTLNSLTWKIWRAPNNASRWQMGFNSAFKVLKGKAVPLEAWTGPEVSRKLTLNSLAWKIW